MIEAYTDGSCLGNPGPGGWAYLINTNPKIEASGGKYITTNNVMEMTAIIKVLEKFSELKYKYVRVFTDSNYVKMGLTEWSKNWERNGWKTVKGDDVKNKDEWIQMVELMRKFDIVDIKWVKAHNGNINNEYVDTKARELAYLFSKK
tara:strand:+ start:23 stop:463 length:441 start_codon:yes stop_codon:yes gene_type:complete